MVWGPGWEVSVATVQVRACRAGQLAQVLEAATHHPPQANVLRAFPIGHMLLLRRVITGPKAPSKPKMRIAGVWDVEELDLAFKTLPREGQGEELIFVAASSDSRGDYQ